MFSETNHELFWFKTITNKGLLFFIKKKNELGKIVDTMSLVTSI